MKVLICCSITHFKVTKIATGCHTVCCKKKKRNNGSKLDTQRETHRVDGEHADLYHITGFNILSGYSFNDVFKKKAGACTEQNIKRLMVITGGVVSC